MYAMDDGLGLVRADRMARTLSPQLGRAQRLLAAHGLVEVRVGPHLLTTAAKTASDGNGLDDNVVDGNSALREAEGKGEPRTPSNIGPTGFTTENCLIQMKTKAAKEEGAWAAWAAWRSPCSAWRAPSSSAPSSPSSPSAPSSTKGSALPRSPFISQPFLQHFPFLDRGLLKAYPAPLAIPLPSYQMGMDSSGGRGLSPAGAPGSGSVGPPLSILHHGDPRRQSTKSHHSSTQQARLTQHVLLGSYDKTSFFQSRSRYRP